MDTQEKKKSKTVEFCVLLKLNCYQLKIDCDKYKIINENLMVTTKQKHMIYMKGLKAYQ